MLRISFVASVALLAVMPGNAPAQGTKADYERADRLRERTRGTVFGARIEPRWFAKGEGFWYRLDVGPGVFRFVLVDPSKKSRREAFDHGKLAGLLTKELGKTVKPDDLPIDRIEPLDDGSLLLRADGKGWKFDPKADKLESHEPPAPPRSASAPPTGRGVGGFGRAFGPRGDTSPDGKWVAFVKDHDVHVREKATGKEHKLGNGGTEEVGDDPRVFWSPDSTRLVAVRVAKAQKHPVSFVASSPTDQLQPKLLTHDYLKPGDRVEVRKPRLYDVTTLKEIPVDDALFANPWSVEQLRWRPDSTAFTFLFNQRGHEVLRVISVDAKTGAASALIEERGPNFVDYSQKTYYRVFDKTNEILWMSERSGWNHLYLIDAKTGRVKNAVTQGDWVVRRVESVDEGKRTIRLRVMGRNPGEDPYHVHFARVNFDGTGFTPLTEGDGTHEIVDSPDGGYLLDTYSRVDLPPVTELRSAADGSLVVALEKADVSRLLATGIRFPERFVAKGRDGETDIHGHIVRPIHHDPKRKYPVIEQIYAGPHGAHVPKTFSPVPSVQSMAELGFILVQIDGMGTNWRSQAFHDVCWKNLADAGFPDRILWMKKAAERDPSMDLTRVGIYGGSAGGQNALGALLFHPEFYKAAAADCGCHDNRMDKIWWNEAWMGWPVGPHYAAQSNVTNAHKLQGKLLLTVGETDHNVDPASTMQVASALIKADKDFEFVVVPGADHGAGEGPYGRRRRRDFFVRNLLGVDPRR